MTLLYEKELEKAWNEFNSQLADASITFKDIQKINHLLEKAYEQIKRQREQITISRDNWKSKYIVEKNKRLGK